MRIGKVMAHFNKYDLDAIVFKNLVNTVAEVPFIDGDTYLSLLDKKYPIIVSMEYDASGIVIYEDRVEFGADYAANDSCLVRTVRDKLMNKPVLQKDKVFIINNKYYQLGEVDGNTVTATLFATFDLETGMGFYWEEEHRIKVDDISVGDAKRLGLI